MSTTKNHPYLRMSEAIDSGDCVNLSNILKSNKDMKEFRVPGFGTWLHYAARYGPLNIVKYLIRENYDVNASGVEGEKPIVLSSRRGDLEISRFLLSEGADLSTSSSLVNPLFAAVLGKSPEVVRLLLDHGIDARVRYENDWKDMDALAFASMWGEMEIAEMIADHLANGDSETKRALLDAALETAMANVEAVPPHEGCPDLAVDD